MGVSVPIPVTGLSRSVFRYMSLPLAALASVGVGAIGQLVRFVQGFINMWECAYGPGPEMDSMYMTQMGIEITMGVVRVTLDRLQHSEMATQAAVRELVESVQCVESKLAGRVTQTMDRCKREVHNLMMETREALRELNALRCGDGVCETQSSSACSSSGVHVNSVSLSSSGCPDGGIRRHLKSPSGDGHPESYYIPGRNGGGRKSERSHFNLDSEQSSHFNLDSGDRSSHFNLESNERSSHRESGERESAPTSHFNLESRESHESHTQGSNERRCDDRHVIKLIDRYMHSKGREMIASVVDERIEGILDRLQRLEEQMADVQSRLDTGFPLGPRPCPAITTFRTEPTAEFPRPWMRRRTEPLNCQC